MRDGRAEWLFVMGVGAVPVCAEMFLDGVFHILLVFFSFAVSNSKAGEKTLGRVVDALCAGRTHI